MTLIQFLEKTMKSPLLFIERGDLMVYDIAENTLYITEDTHRRTQMNPIVDSAHLLWSGQYEVACGNEELSASISGRKRVLITQTPEYSAWKSVYA